MLIEPSIKLVNNQVRKAKKYDRLVIFLYYKTVESKINGIKNIGVANANNHSERARGMTFGLVISSSVTCIFKSNKRGLATKQSENKKISALITKEMIELTF